MYEHFQHSSLYQNRPIRADFIITAAYLLRNLGLFLTSVSFQAFTSLNSIAVSANRQVLPSKIEHGFIEFLGREQSSTPWPHFELKYPGYRNIVSELDFFKNEITNYARVVSRRKSSFERLKFEEITTFRSLEDEYRTISVSTLLCGHLWKQHHTDTYLLAIYIG